MTEELAAFLAWLESPEFRARPAEVLAAWPLIDGMAPVGA